MAKHSRDVAFIAAIVYFVQGALGISGIALPIFLRNLNWTVTEITSVSSIAALPWIAKIIYGLISDSFPLFGYRRKSYLVLCSIISSLGWMGLIILPPEKHLILISLLIANLGFAATDVITDGLIVEHSTEITSPIYQGISWGFRSFGAIISGFIGGWLAANWRPHDVFLLTMLLPFTVTTAACLILEKKRARGPFKTALAPLKRCFSLIQTSNIRWFIAILIMVSIAASFTIPFFFYMKETLHFHETFLGLLISTGWAGAMIGSLIYVKLLRHISPKILIQWAIILNSVNILSSLLIFNTASAFILVLIGGVLSCITMLPIMSSAARLTHHTGVEGTLFAILMSVYNLGQIGFGYLGGKAYDYIGLSPLIIITGVLALMGLLFVRKLNFEISN